MRTKPPFRADHVGSILRTEPLRAAREKFYNGRLSAAALTEIENQEIRKIVAKQEEIGLEVVTDGEFRRSWWHMDFLDGLDGVEVVEADQGIQFTGVQTKSRAPRVMGKLGSKRHPHIDHFRFLNEVTKKTAKQSIPSPSMLHYRGGRKMINMGVYPTMEEFYHDLGQAYKQAITGFYDAGCRYIQIDDCSFAYLCDPKQREMLAARGDDPTKQGDIYVGMINAALEGRAADLCATMHVCRGNFRSTFISSGGYEPIADLMFNKLNIDGYFLEWDNDRAGGFEPLRFLPKGHKIVILGLITTKSGELEKRDDILRRIDEAAKFAPLDQLCLSPQCGFASTEEGNTLAEEQQWAKLKLVIDISMEVWGK